MTSIIPLLFVWSVLISMVLAMASFDKIIRWLYKNKKEDWIAIGSPTGYLFRPEEAILFKSATKTTELANRAFFFTPKWISENNELNRALWFFRGFGLCAILGMIGVAFTV